MYDNFNNDFFLKERKNILEVICLTNYHITMDINCDETKINHSQKFLKIIMASYSTNL